MKNPADRSCFKKGCCRSKLRYFDACERRIQDSEFSRQKLADTTAFRRLVFEFRWATGAGLQTLFIEASKPGSVARLKWRRRNQAVGDHVTFPAQMVSMARP